MDDKTSLGGRMKVAAYRDRDGYSRCVLRDYTHTDKSI